MLRAILAVIGACTCALSGCASPPGDAQVAIPPGQYEQAFNITRDVLRESHFDLDRVDARAGVITTRPTSASGFATPWIDHTSDAGAAFQSTINRERRVASVRFSTPEADASGDLREATGAMTEEVQVLIQRIHKAGRRVDSISPRAVSYTRDPMLDRDPGVVGVATDVETVGPDPALAARIAERIQRRLDEASSKQSAHEHGDLAHQQQGNTL